MKNKNSEISLNNYQKLLSEIQKQIQQSEDSIIKTVTRQKVVMAWKIGKIIGDHLAGYPDSKYGEKLIDQLSVDISITPTVLYKMQSFYKTYPKIPKDDAGLNWSHYRALSGIKKTDEREYLENLAIENSWSTTELEEEIRKLKVKKSSKTNTALSTLPDAKKTLRPVRGELFSYALITIGEKKQTYIDCGFNIFKEIETNLKGNNQIARVKKENGVEKYSLKKSNLAPKKINIYQAYLERVVDGDTIRVVLDLGFKIHHREIIRLRGINAPEIKTAEGKKSARVLNDVLRGKEILIIKTFSTDIYGRYVADVFFDDGDGKMSPKQIAAEGVYLNQLLLDKESTVIW